VALGGLAVFQVLLIAGAPLGRFAWGGQNVVVPPRLRMGSAVSVALYAVFAVLMVQAAGAFSVLPDGAAAVGIWVLAGYFVLGVAESARLVAAVTSRPNAITGRTGAPRGSVRHQDCRFLFDRGGGVKACVCW
jgi:hypothetical protein